MADGVAPKDFLRPLYLHFEGKDSLREWWPVLAWTVDLAMISEVRRCLHRWRFVIFSLAFHQRGYALIGGLVTNLASPRLQPSLFHDPVALLLSAVLVASRSLLTCFGDPIRTCSFRLLDAGVSFPFSALFLCLFVIMLFFFVRVLVVVVRAFVFFRPSFVFFWLCWPCSSPACWSCSSLSPVIVSCFCIFVFCNVSYLCSKKEDNS
ncbi:hypothetical protein HRI_000706300 [Hibiscus trionum]|uniref:Transmembrane protein n=1 Tax=Hibiscus trionum TaxID=183268 RepID=A0A9W7LP48_HIBTR|nr:hypothetical protein HRI_000706300 [Hibiscus trionum]